MIAGLMSFLASWWVAYVVFGVATLLGGALAVHNPQKEQKGVRWCYGIGFVLLFLLGLLVTKAQHDDSMTQVAKATQQAKQDVSSAITSAVQKAVQPYQAKIDGQAAQIDQINEGVAHYKHQ